MADRPVAPRAKIQRSRHGQHAPLDEWDRRVVHVASHQIRIPGAVDERRGLRLLCRSAQRDEELSFSCLSYDEESVGAQAHARRGPGRVDPGANGIGQTDVNTPVPFRVSANSAQAFLSGLFGPSNGVVWFFDVFFFVYIPSHLAL